MMRLRPLNWGALQHYKGRNPPWVKLHKNLLDDFAFQSLPLASRALAPMLWLLASEDAHGWIAAEAGKIAFRLRITEEELAQALAPLLAARLFEMTDASTLLAGDAADAMPETEAETETETETEAEPESLSDPPAPAASGDTDPSVTDSRKGKGKNPYTEEFEAFWRAYPTDPLMSKKRAFERWRWLSAEDRVAAAAVLPAFKAHCRKNPTYRTVHAERFLSQRRFDGFAQTPAPPSLDASALRAQWDGRASALVDELGAGTFAAWFKDAGFRPGPPPQIVVATAFMADWINHQLATALRRHLGEDCRAVTS